MKDKKQEMYEAVEQAKKDANASGIDALTRDVRKTAEGTVAGAKEAGDKMVNDVDDEFTASVEKLQKDTNGVIKDTKNNVKQNLGVGTKDPSRYAKADKLTENIKEASKDEEIYMSRKRARYQ